MHLATCSCLNVKIFTKVDLKNSKLASIDPLPQHTFFTNHSAREVILHIQGIQIEQNVLIERAPVEGWMIHRCINCLTLTHAKHLDDDRTLVSSDLVSVKSEIDKLLSSPNYSSLYRIIVEKPSTISSNLTVSDNIRNVMQSIQSNFENYIKKEEVELNNRIKKFEAAEREKFDGMKSKLMQEKNTLLSVIVNNDPMKIQDESDSNEFHDSSETHEKDVPGDANDPLKNTPCGSQNIQDEEVACIPSIPDAKPSDDIELTPDASLPIKSNINKLFGAINMDYSPILSPLTFGVSTAIPEEEEDNGGVEVYDIENDDESETNKDTKISTSENAVLKRTELKLPLKQASVEKAFVDQKVSRPVSKLLKRDADKESVGSLEPEDVFFLNVDSDDQRGDISINFTSDEDEILQHRAENADDDNLRSALCSTSVPIKVPLSFRQNSREVDMIEDTPMDAESMAASFLALARSCHGDAEIFGELPRPRLKTHLQHASRRMSSEEPHLVN